MNPERVKLRVTLEALDTKSGCPKAKSTHVFGEVDSVYAAYALNTIPTMTVSVNPGAKLKDDGGLRARFTDGKKFRDLVKSRKPVGVFMTSDRELPGLPDGKVCIFKGYITGMATAAGPGAGNIQLTITHWLTDLNLFGILHRLSDPENGADLSSLAMFRGAEESSESSTLDQALCWDPGTLYKTALKKELNVFKALKTGLLAALKETGELKESDPGFISQELFQNVETALNAVEDRYLEFSGSMAGDTEDYLAEAIGDTLSKEVRGSYYAVTVWQKLVKSFFPSFLMALTPLVDRAVVIPSPGTVMNPNTCRMLSLNEITELRTRRSSGAVLGGVFLATRHTADAKSGLVKSNPSVSVWRYPEELQPGTLHVCYLPDWLEQYILNTAVLSIPLASDCAFTGKNAVEEVPESAGPINDEICKAFVKTAYISQLTREHGASLILPLRFDIVPGDNLGIELPRNLLKGKEEYIYGTVIQTTLEISQGTAHCSLALANLRTQEQFEEFSFSESMLYADGWRHPEDTDVKLYSEEK